MKIQKKWGHSWLLVLMVLAATSMRFILLINNWPTTNSDEANMGIAALRIAYHGEWPAMFYGQGYMGPIEAYLAAPIFRLLGSSLLNLRLGLLLFYVAFVLAMYYFTSFLYTKKFALFISLLLCLGSKEVIVRQLKAVGEYPELPLLAIIICILVLKIVWPYDKAKQEKGDRWRTILYFLLGLAIAIAIWVDFLILPFVVTGLILLFLLAKKELLSASGLWLLLGFLIGIAPIIIYNVTVPFDQSTFASVAGVINATHGKSYSILQKVAGAFFIGIPNTTDYAHQCSPTAFPGLGGDNGKCIILQGGWSLGYLVLWTLALWKAIRSLRVERKDPLNEQKENRQKQISAYIRLMVLVSVGMTIVSYALSTSAAAVPGPTARYLVCVMLSLPVVLWQLWPQKNDRFYIHTRRLSPMLSFTNICILLLVLGVFVSGIFETFADLAEAQQFAQQQTSLVQRLQALGATRVYTEYWTCNRLIFESKEQIICGVLNDDLTPGLNRYPPYQIEMQKAPRPVYVFPFQSQFDLNFSREQAKSHVSQKYHYIKYAGYSIYIPD